MKSNLIRVIKVVITILLLALLFSKVNVREVINAFTQVNLFWLAGSIVIGIAMVLVRWLKWHLIVKAGLEQADHRETFASLLGGMTFALVTPARVGELSRVAFLSGSRTEASGLVFVDRFIDLSVILIFGTIGMSVVLGREQLPLLLPLIAFFIIGIFKLDFFLSLGSRLIPFKKLKDLVVTASAGLRRLTPADLATNFALTLLLTTLDIISFYMLVRALGGDNFKAVVFVFPLIMLTNLLPITISGVGVRENTAVWLFAKFAVTSTVAFNATFISYLLNSLAPALCGIYFFRRLAPELKLGETEEKELSKESA